jgi:hypothetical protein
MPPERTSAPAAPSAIGEKRRTTSATNATSSWSLRGAEQRARREEMRQCTDPTPRRGEVRDLERDRELATRGQRGGVADQARRDHGRERQQAEQCPRRALEGERRPPAIPHATTPVAARRSPRATEIRPTVVAVAKRQRSAGSAPARMVTPWISATWTTRLANAARRRDRSGAERPEREAPGQPSSEPRGARTSGAGARERGQQHQQSERGAASATSIPMSCAPWRADVLHALVGSVAIGEDAEGEATACRMTVARRTFHSTR